MVPPGNTCQLLLTQSTGQTPYALTQSTWPLWLAAAEIRAGQSACLCIILCVGVCPNAVLPVRAPMLALLVSWVALPHRCHGSPLRQSVTQAVTQVCV